jgi:protein involved in polysaccharide export with SLBB domain
MNHVHRPIKILICLLLGIGLNRAGAQDNSTPQTSDVLLPGDMVRIVVWQNPELSGEFLVNPEGTLAHPVYQEVQVAGLPLAEAKRRLRQFLAASYTKDPLIIVEPLMRVSISGEVRAPNLYPVPRGTSVSQAVALAGGLTEAGDPSDAILLRNGEVIKLDLTRPEPLERQIKVASGDQIVVGRHGNFFRDFIGPFSALTAAVVSLVVVFQQ